MSHWVVRDGWYQGSHLLKPVSETVGVQLDKLNYVIAGFSCILLGTIYRTVLHPSKVTPLARKLFTFLVGFFVLYFCFGTDVKHMFIQSGISYLLLMLCPIESLPRLTLFFCLGYQSILHAIRMYYDYEGYTLDVTGEYALRIRVLVGVLVRSKPSVTERLPLCQPLGQPDSLFFFFVFNTLRRYGFLSPGWEDDATFQSETTLSVGSRRFFPLC